MHEPSVPPSHPIAPSSIPRASVGRLSLYLRELRRLSDAGEKHVSSKRIGELLGVSDSIVRRDLGYLSPRGKRGVGYQIDSLVRQICWLLGSNQSWNVVLVGAGSLGKALLNYPGFQQQGFRWVAAFEIDETKLNDHNAAIPIFSNDQLERQIVARSANLAVLAVPATAAGEMARRLSAAGIAAILNFAPVVLQVPADVCVANVDLASELQQLVYNVLSRASDDPP